MRKKNRRVLHLIVFFFIFFYFYSLFLYRCMTIQNQNNCCKSPPNYSYPFAPPPLNVNVVDCANHAELYKLFYPDQKFVVPMTFNCLQEPVLRKLFTFKKEQ